MTFNIEIRYETRYRMFFNSILNALNLENIDIEGRNIRYRSSTISKNIRYWSKKDRYRLSTISKKHRYRSSKLRYHYILISKKTSISKFKTSISLYPDIENFSISINAPSISVYDVEAFLFDIECSVLRYRCFFAWSAVARARLGTHCRVHVWPVAYAGPAACNDAKFKFGDDGPVRSQHRPQPPEARLPEWLLQPPERASTEPRSAWFLETRIDWRQVCSSRNAGRSRRSGHQRNAGACDFWRQELNGVKFGMIMWTRIGGSCVDLLPIPQQCQISTEKNKFVGMISFNKYLVVIFREKDWLSERRMDFPREGLTWKRIGGSCLSLLQTKTMDILFFIIYFQID